VVHDLTVAYTVWGYLDDAAAPELVALRKPLFEGVGHLHSYVEKRVVADAVPDETLRKSPEAVKSEHAANWKALLDLDAAKPVSH
jgi:hypothetical protein